MKLSKKLEVTKEEFFDRLCFSVLEDIKKYSGSIRIKKGLQYTKKLSNGTTANVEISDEIDLKKNEIPHGILSTAFINSNELLKENFDKEDIKILAYSVALHHERDISEIEDEDFKEEIKKMEFELIDFETELNRIEYPNAKQRNNKRAAAAMYLYFIDMPIMKSSLQKSVDGFLIC